MDCIDRVYKLQTETLVTYGDIAYNFVIGNNNAVYEGRGFQVQPAGLNEYNKIGIHIAFIGFYNETAPTAEQFDLLQRFLRKSIKDGFLEENYLMYVSEELFGHDVKGVFFEEVKKWPNYTPALRIVDQKEWGASRFSNFKFEFKDTTTSIVFGHTETNSCQTLVTKNFLL